MKPSEISLFTEKEQTLLVGTEPDRLEKLDADELSDMLGRVRRARKKYTDLDRRQNTAAIAKAGRRSVTGTSTQRTLRKAEIFEDATSRVSRQLSRVARANANILKRERIDAAKKERPAPKAKKKATAAKKPTASRRTASKPTSKIAPARKGATSAANKRNQARRDGGKKK